MGKQFSTADERVIERFRQDIRPKFDPDYSRRMHKVHEHIGFLGMFFDKADIRGLGEYPQRQRVYLGNHLSHFDYMLAWHAFSAAGFPIPSFGAGKNLDHPLVLGLLGMNFRKHNAFIIDRAMFENGVTDESKLYAEALEREFNNLLDHGHDPFVFPDGGRNYQGKVLPRPRRTVFKYLTREDRELRDLDIVPVAFDYNRRIEEAVFPHLHRNGSALGMLKYYALDLGSFVARIVAPHLRDSEPYKCGVSFGEPVALKDLVGDYEPNRRCGALMDFVQGRVQELHSDLHRTLDGKALTK